VNYPIPGFDGYFVTSEGIAISRHGRPLATYRDRDGYNRATLALGRGKNVKRVHRGIHQLVCLAFHGPAPEGQEVRHLDGDKTNNRPENLCYSTHLVNIRDRTTHGTVPQGESHGMAKLTRDKVRDIRFLSRLGFNDCEVAREIGVSPSTIRLIRIGRIWRKENAA
jgi:hypothetical protein